MKTNKPVMQKLHPNRFWLPLWRGSGQGENAVPQNMREFMKEE